LLGKPPLRVTAEERELLDRLMAATGFASISEVIRQGVRSLAKEQGVPIVRPTGKLSRR
jgi:Arc/MetJ-type ribon-helix-helix transcriptional regulator